jgi:uncharacterized membrane protein YphA (DoxX/SURF4 family)
MRQRKAKKPLQTVVRIALATIFLYAATMKVWRDNGGDASSTIFSEWSRSMYVRYLIIGAETGLGVWLLLGVQVDLAGIFAMVTSSAFTGLVVFEFNAQHPKSCGCTGGNAVAVNPQSILSSLRFDLGRNVLMITGAGWLCISAKAQRRPVLGHGRRFPLPTAAQVLRSTVV